jgi:hypothetical protein
VYVSPSNTILLSLADEENRYREFRIVMTGVQCKNVENIQVYDFDNDGINDLLVFDQTTNDLLALKGKGNGTFFSPKKILSLKERSVFRCGDFNGDSRTDIAYTDPINNEIIVVYDAIH